MKRVAAWPLVLLGCLSIATIGRSEDLLVVEMERGPSRDLVVVVDGQAHRVRSIPLAVPDPPPTPTPGPTPSPAPAPVPGPAPEPAEDLSGIANAYAAASRVAAAHGFSQAADGLAAGKTVAQSLADGAAVSEQERSKAFTRIVGPTFSRVLPEATEPSSPAQRAELEQLWRQFAAALAEVNP